MAPTGTVLREARHERGLSLREAAHSIGVDVKTLQRSETGRCAPHPRNRRKIADFYGLRVAEIWPVPAEVAA